MYINQQRHFNVLLLEAYPIWIGATDEAIEGQWVWYSTGDAINFNNWNPPNPDNAHGNEDCAIMHVSGKWNDLTCDLLERHVVCEIAF